MKKKLFLISLIAIVANAFGITTNDTMYPSKELGDIINDTPMYDAETIDNIVIEKADLTNVIFKSDLQAALESNKTDKAETVFGSIDRANETWDALNELIGNEIEEHSFTRAIYSDGTTNDYEIIGILTNKAVLKANLISIEIGNTVTSIGDNAFSTCHNLISATIPNSVTNIESFAFYKCSGLTSVAIPASVTSIGENAFYGCTNLTSVTIPDSVTDIRSYAFRDCSGLMSVTIGNSVTSIKSFTFFGCSSLTSVTIPSSVTNIGWAAFDNCSGLTSVTIPDSVTSIGDYVFEGCNNLQTIYYTHSKDQTSEQAVQSLKIKLINSNSGLDLDSIEFIDITLNPKKFGNFDPNNRIYTSDQVDELIAPLASTNDLENYLPLTGGTITGSLAQGVLVEATGQYSHAEGMMATAAGNYSHAEGWYTKANGDISHATGISAKANDNMSYVWSGEQFTEVDEYCFDVANETIINPFDEFDNKVPVPMTINGMLGIESELWTDWIVQIDLHDSDFEEGNFIEIEYDADNTRWICRTDEEILDVTDSPCTAEFFNHNFKFVYVGENEPNEFEICKDYGKEFYESHGEGTYNIDPVGGLGGFYIGDSSLKYTLNRYALLTELNKYLPLTGGKLNESGYLIGGSQTSFATSGSIAFGFGTQANKQYAAAFNRGITLNAKSSFGCGIDAEVLQDHEYSFIWSGRIYPNIYYSHALGSFNIDPEGGITNFWIGNTNLYDIVSTISDKVAHEVNYTNVFVQYSQDSGDDEPYELTVDLSKGNIQKFESNDNVAKDVEITIPACTDKDALATLILYVEQNWMAKDDDDEDIFIISSENIAESSWPEEQPWMEDDYENSTWKIEFESPPGTTKWYYLKATKYDYSHLDEE